MRRLPEWQAIGKHAAKTPSIAVTIRTLTGAMPTYCSSMYDHVSVSALPSLSKKARRSTGIFLGRT